MKQVWYHYKLGIRPKVTSANLAFGKAVDDTVMDYLKAVTLGNRISSIEDVFLRHWKKQSSISLEYSSTQSEKKMREMGAAMAGKFPAAWEESELMVFIMPDGSPALQVELAVQIAPRVSLRGYLDLIAMDQLGRVIILDIKTTGVAYDDLYVRQSDQLTAYQLLVDSHASTLGIEQADQVGFMCLHKKKDPVIHSPQIVDRRPSDRVSEYIQTCQWFVNDYNNGRFNRSPLGAFNSPCSMCDFNRLCSEGCTEDLDIPDRAKVALQLAA
jgi:hypothetical protein|tara:strand:- start:21307 stop:22116 length:810 start_codon:yes stop_codon:yes gene_type:complete